MDQTLTDPVLKRADELAVGDRIQPGFLPAYARSGEGTVRYLETYHYQGADWVFAAFACADGDRNCAYYLPGGMLQVFPADTGLGYSRADDGEVTQPIAGRLPAHYGAVEAAGGLVDIDAEPKCSPECDALAVPGAPSGLARMWHDDECPVVPLLDKEKDRELRDEWTAMVNAEREDN